MGLEFDEVSDKPERWPANAIECHLDNICNQVNKFKQNPTYKNKEVLVSLVTAYDLNQTSMTGLIRTTDYEVACINSLYVDASIIQLNALKTYLYELVGYKTRIQKMVSWFPKIKETSEVEAFCGLLPQLRLYYVTYHNFTIAKNKKYVSHLINFVTEMIEDSRKNDSDALFCELIGNVTCSYVSLLNDISYFRCVKRTRIWAFDREEIYSLFQLAAKLIKLNRESPVVSPLKGVLMTSISNYILKSRNDYSDAYICKYISPEVAKQSIVNHQIWMSVIEHLNDERERRVIPELFDEVGWGSYSWAKNMNFMPRRKYYVSSFCKSLNNEKMKKDYGECIYGYKDDRMAEILAPIVYRPSMKTPSFSQVLAFDVLYDKNEAKREIEFLCRVIDCFSINDEEKKLFLEEILQYWLLSVKDPKWANEKERRYILFLYDNYDYHETDFTDSSFLKLKTSLFLEPDFILGENPVKSYITNMVDNKRYSISVKPYLFCKDCLNRDFDILVEEERITNCTICNSNNISIENLK